MAEANESTVDILNCTICLETLKKPKSLPCLHTFCESCLVSYITSGLEKHQENINCPLCRETVNRPSKTCTPKEWVEDLPSNFLLAGLIERRKVERSEKLCMLCERAGKQPIENATYFCAQCTDTLCQTCEIFHRHLKLFSDHNVKPINEISNEAKLFPEPRNTCDEHKNETLKLYCVDHKTACCCICVSIYHRKCEEVKSIEDAAKGIAASGEIKELRDGYENLENNFKINISKNKTATEKLENDYETALQTIESKYKILRKALNEQESKRKSELEKMYSEMKDRKEGILIGLENKQKTIENERKVFEACLQGASETQIFLEMTKFQKLLKTHEKEKEVFKTETLEIGSGLCLVNIDTANLLLTIEKFLKVIREQREYQIIRYGSLGPDSSGWNVRSKIDAIVFEVSSDIFLCGFLSYGCIKHITDCNVQISVKHGNKTVLEFKTVLSKKLQDYQNNITELKLDKPIHLSSNTKYEVLFVMDCSVNCYYGEYSEAEVNCEGVTFKFSDSKQSNNGTDVNGGQIPGFVFKKAD